MLHIFYGSDSFSLREEFGELKASLDKDGSLAANIVTFSASKVSPQEVIAACDTVPFLGDQRLVVVEGLFGKGSRSRDQDGDDDGEPAVSGGWDSLVEYVDGMPGTTVLVLIGGDKAGGALLKALRSKAEIHHSKLPDQKAVMGWVQKRSRSIGVKLDARSARALADLVGNDTWRLATELEKLSSFANGQMVSEADVRDMVASARELPPWDILDPIVEGRGAGALKALRRVLDLRQMHPLEVMARVQGAYRRMAIAREMLDSGATGTDIGARLNMRGFPLEKLIDQASAHTASAIRAAYARMVEADLDVKRGIFDVELALELLVTDLATSRSRAA
ncbi:MAG: DNA polymerase III subunit delta [Chloroflexi bacterium]|nr:DNA polymerase III subunit delta [Chloroflexota bacterium]